MIKTRVELAKELCEYNFQNMPGEEALAMVDYILREGAHIARAEGYAAGQAATRKRALTLIPGGDLCDPQEIADAIRALPIEPESKA